MGSVLFYLHLHEYILGKNNVWHLFCWAHNNIEYDKQWFIHFKWSIQSIQQASVFIYLLVYWVFIIMFIYFWGIHCGCRLYCKEKLVLGLHQWRTTGSKRLPFSLAQAGFLQKRSARSPPSHDGGFFLREKKVTPQVMNSAQPPAAEVGNKHRQAQTKQLWLRRLLLKSE